MFDMTRVRRFARRNRRALAAASAGLSVLGLGLALRPAVPHTQVVAVAAADMPAGHRLAAADLEQARVAAALTPPGVVPDPALLAGRVLAAPVAGGEPITTLRLVGEEGGWQTTPGMLAVPVRAADPAAATLLAAGQRVDLLATPMAGVDTMVGTGPPTLARVVAEDVLILAIVEPAEGAGLLGGSGDLGGAPLVVVEASAGSAPAIVGAGASGGVWFTVD